MNNPHYENRLPGNAKYGAICAVNYVAISRSEKFIFRNQRTALRKLLQRLDLLFQSQNKGCGILWAIIGDVGPDFLYIPLGCWRNMDAIFYGHL